MLLFNFEPKKKFHIDKHPQLRSLVSILVCRLTFDSNSFNNKLMVDIAETN